MSFDVEVENRTPFSAMTHVQHDADGQEVLVAMFSASFEAPERDARLDIAAAQLPVILGDVPRGVPGLSSNRYDADIAPRKPASEIVVNGTAYSPKGKPAHEMQVGFRVNGLQKVLHVIGDRIYDAGAYSEPHPFRTMPVIYERAFGGMTTAAADAENPVGIGFRHAVSADPSVRTHAPNITYPDQMFRGPQDRPRAAGFGPIGRNWRQRLQYAGTYDQAWIDNQWPLPPKDFDLRHHMSTPPDQHLPRIVGGEDVRLIGLTPSGCWDFRMPRVIAPIRLLFADRVEEREFVADTAIIEPDLWRITLKSRIALLTRRNAPALRAIVFGQVTPALLAAKRKRKQYFSHYGGNGTLRDRPLWQP
ncbi:MULTISPECIES: DUF2169 domain-containing protein [unclassified Mesorhizobium]|uniref:DUF2169 family type VI secretion system accessory protein n=1 Tax=unclassified Mesorhizobium TaxID=325217 RepID=UPI00112A47AA|nr:MULTISPECIES: DUF2169 domain-containing protein [unclassified Mesorhizobium]MBZ9896172.1 DUF2169 domain-containing protein [Mesorhizobium sp. BR1-1-6]MCA0055498.1 DUF2169 domain-containing protein [Mesorhizobium sp. B261B1A]TPK32316.1 DUF2169 domain-containing protein [Mesorhizobium sp. B2-5-3]TPL14432.1 DUF2169 domain-containing protein [Mesorhizobium sp. B2-4-11]TPL17315.1 DUF2169 domain-containing protein [Mesorhizobium sp. B2-4-10]